MSKDFKLENMKDLNEATIRFNEALLKIKDKWEPKLGPFVNDDIEVLLDMYKEGLKRGSDIAIKTITREYC